MPPLNVRFHEEAAAEVEAARQWYAEPCRRRTLSVLKSIWRLSEFEMALSDGPDTGEALVDIYYPDFLSA